MPDWWAGAVGTFALSLILACGFLRLRCRGVGPPFGPRAKFWASFIVVATAIVSTAVGLLIVAASHRMPTAYTGIIVPGGLWFTKLPPGGDRLSSGRTFPAAVLTAACTTGWATTCRTGAIPGSRRRRRSRSG
jgi:hypothetical protein